MNQPRFMHAAAQVASAPGRVLLVGGTGGVDSAATWEVFDNDRAGGYGVYQASANRLATARAMPGAVGIGDRVWIVGGATATDNAQLAEIWTQPAEDPNGVTEPAIMSTQFPNMAPAGMELHPEYSLLRPQVAAIGERVLAVGWYGPQCEVGMSTPVYPAATTTEFCGPPSAPMTRSFTITDATGLTIPTQARPRAFGGTAVLTCFRATGTEQYTAFVGGIGTETWSPQATIDLFDGSVDASGAAVRVEGSVSLSAPRLFQTATGVPGLGIVTIGGASFGVGIDQLFFFEATEVLFLESPDPDNC